MTRPTPTVTKIGNLVQHGNAARRAPKTPHELSDTELVTHVLRRLRCGVPLLGLAMGVHVDTIKRWRSGRYRLPAIARRRMQALRAITRTDHLVIITYTSTQLPPMRRRRRLDP